MDSLKYLAKAAAIAALCVAAYLALRALTAAVVSRLVVYLPGRLR